MRTPFSPRIYNGTRRLQEPLGIGLQARVFTPFDGAKLVRICWIQCRGGWDRPTNTFTSIGGFQRGSCGFNHGRVLLYVAQSFVCRMVVRRSTQA